MRDNIAVYQGAIQKGRAEEKLSIASLLKQMGMSDSDIARATGLSIEEIESID